MSALPAITSCVCETDFFFSEDLEQTLGSLYLCLLQRKKSDFTTVERTTGIRPHPLCLLSLGDTAHGILMMFTEHGVAAPALLLPQAPTCDGPLIPVLIGQLIQDLQEGKRMVSTLKPRVWREDG